MNPFSSSSSAKMKNKANHNFISWYLQEIFSHDLHKNKVDDYGSLKIGALKDAETYQRTWNALHMGGDSNLIERILCAIDVVVGKCRDYGSLKADCNHKSELNCRTLVCAPTNVAIKEVALRVLSIVRESFDRNSDALLCNLGDMLLFGNHERLKIGAEIEEMYLDYLVKQLILCFSSPNNWKDLFGSMIDLLDICISDYHVFIENEIRKELVQIYHNNSNGAIVDNPSNSGARMQKSFIEFFRERFLSVALRLRDCVSILSTHISRSCIMEHNLKDLARRVSEYSLHHSRTEYLSLLRTGDLDLRDVVTEESIRETSSLIFSAASSSFKLHSVVMEPLGIRRPSFKTTYRPPSIKKHIIKKRPIVQPQIIFSYWYHTFFDNLIVSDTSLAIIPFPENAADRIDNPEESGLPIGIDAYVASLINGLVFVIGNQFHRVANPVTRAMSGASQTPPIVNSEFVTYFIGFDSVLNRYKFFSFWDLANEGVVEGIGTHIHGFTLGVDHIWREVAIIPNLVIAFEYHTNGGIQTFTQGDQSSHVNFNGVDVQLGHDVILSFNCRTEVVTTILPPEGIPGNSIVCCLENRLCCANLSNSTLQIHRWNENWVLIVEVQIIPHVPDHAHAHFLPICLRGDKLLLAFRADLVLPDDPHFGIFNHGAILDISTGTIELINCFRPVNWFGARTFTESDELLPY